MAHHWAASDAVDSAAVRLASLLLQSDDETVRTASKSVFAVVKDSGLHPSGKAQALQSSGKTTSPGAGRNSSIRHTRRTDSVGPHTEPLLSTGKSDFGVQVDTPSSSIDAQREVQRLRDLCAEQAARINELERDNRDMSNELAEIALERIRGHIQELGE